MKTKLLTPSDINEIVAKVDLNEILDRLIAALHDGFSKLDAEQLIVPPRTGIHYRNPDLGLLEWMPAYLRNQGASLKIVGYHPTNPDQRSLPTVISSIGLFDTDSGHLKGLLDGTFLTAIRTGCMSAIATRALALPQSATLGIVGSGAQAVTQCHALSRLFDIEQILIHDKDPQAMHSFASRVPFLDTEIKQIPSSELKRLLEQSDILCTCTSEEPNSGALFADFENRKHLHINAVGSDFPGKVEIPLDLLNRALVVPDFLEQAINEGECQQLSPETIECDLAQVLRNPAKFDEKKNHLTVFDSTGHAVADNITGNFFIELANEFKLGTELELECIPTDPKDPYSFLAPHAISKARQSKKLVSSDS